MLKRFVFLLLLWPIVGYSAHITDKLLAGMYAKPSSAEQPVQLLPSGTPVELIGEQDGFVKVELVDGKVGWVEKRFLSEDKPAKVRLLALQSKYRQLQGKLDIAEKKLEGFGKAPSQVVEAVVNSDELSESVRVLKARLVEVKNEVSQLQKEQVQQELVEAGLRKKLGRQEMFVEGGASPGISWFIIPLMLVIAAAVGVIMGIRIQDKRQLKRHGGFRI